MSKSYRLGLLIVLGTVAVFGLVCGATVDQSPSAPPRAAHDLGPGSLPLGEFRFEERSGRVVTQSDLRDRVWVAVFIFTRCPLSCPVISGVMNTLQKRLANTDALLVSISVDPEYDTPAVLKDYADRFGASPERWWFLRAPKEQTYDFVHNRFKLALAESTADERASGAEMIGHSDRLALVDRGQVVGFFESRDAKALDELVARASRLALPGWVRGLPAINASLNALCALLLMAGWYFIRVWPSGSPRSALASRAAGSNPLDRPGARAHVTCMLLAVATSALFLACYLAYHYQAGSMRFRHGGVVRWLYFTILWSHTALATFGVVPLVILTLALAARRDFARHARVAQVTFPIWVYVSITGVVIYLLLYHLPLPASLGQASSHVL